jgi:hypothetical protein
MTFGDNQGFEARGTLCYRQARMLQGFITETSKHACKCNDLPDIPAGRRRLGTLIQTRFVEKNCDIENIMERLIISDRPPWKAFISSERDDLCDHDDTGYSTHPLVFAALQITKKPKHFPWKLFLVPSRFV